MSKASSLLPPSPSSTSCAFRRMNGFGSADHRYFLDSCFLCKTPLHVGDDIYMYRGDIPFCSEECRQQQIDIDEAEERSRSKMTSKNKPKPKIGGGSSSSSSSSNNNNNNATSKSCEVPLSSPSTAVVG